MLHEFTEKNLRRRSRSGVESLAISPYGSANETIISKIIQAELIF